MPCNMCWPLKRSFFIKKKNMTPTKSYLMICLPLILDLPISRSPTSILKPPSDSPRQPKPSPIGPQAAPYGTQRYRHVRLPSCTGRKNDGKLTNCIAGVTCPPRSSRNIWKPFLALIFWFSMTSVYSNWVFTLGWDCGGFYSANYVNYLQLEKYDQCFSGIFSQEDWDFPIGIGFQ